MYSYCFGKDKEKVIDSSYFPIADKDSIFVNPTLPLTFVLFVPISHLIYC